MLTRPVGMFAGLLGDFTSTFGVDASDAPLRSDNISGVASGNTATKDSCISALSAGAESAETSVGFTSGSIAAEAATSWVEGGSSALAPALSAATAILVESSGNVGVSCLHSGSPPTASCGLSVGLALSAEGAISLTATAPADASSASVVGSHASSALGSASTKTSLEASSKRTASATSLEASSKRTASASTMSVASVTTVAFVGVPLSTTAAGTAMSTPGTSACFSIVGDSGM
mmetsp:Transcript_48132/g.108087  ORF Transcript_48132/g.108087 Transcript_48132/m.108087 type:complete len:234 (+) Transcript_48132:1157-1858(+)